MRISPAAHLRGEPVVEAIAREIRWAAARVQSKEPLQ